MCSVLAKVGHHLRGGATIKLGISLQALPFLNVRGIKKKMSTVPPLVSCQWLQEKRSSPNFFQNFRILDTTWDLKMFNRDFEKEHFDCRIPGAKRFDLSACCDKTTDLPHMLPSAKEFTAYVKDLGVENKHHVILYDNSTRFGLFSAPRVWWTFRCFGHDKVSILDGGLPKWIQGGYQTCSKEYSTEETLPDLEKEFEANYRPELVRDLEMIFANAKSDMPVQVMDARPSGRFNGTAPEPRPDIPSGHIPQSKNVPFFNCFDMKEKVMKPKEEVQKVFEDAGINLDKEVIATCGSGVTASVIAFAAYFAHGKDVPVYDGSWTEWVLSDKVPRDMLIKQA